MQYIVPNYYKKFECIAGDCLHSCCCGWEIDVDEDKADFYYSYPGPFREKLRSHIHFSQEQNVPSHFIMGEDMRCPFLNGDNLCDMILAMGEDSLCQICSDHPRYRNFMADRIEMGIGLTCEEAARLIITNQEKVSLIPLPEAEWTFTDRKMAEEESEVSMEEQADLLALREELLLIAQNRLITINERLEEILDFASLSLPDWTLSTWADRFSDLERLDPQWTEVLTMIKSGSKYKVETADFEQEKWQIAFEQLLVYMLLRHLPESLYDYDVLSKIAFSVLAVQFVREALRCHLHIHGQAGLDDMAEYARLFSSEIEYNMDNLYAVYDLLF